MKAPKLGLVATLSAAALILTACGSDDSGSDASDSNSDIKICMYTHGDGGAFWSVAKKGAEKAADDLGVELDYQESNNDPAKQAELIEAGITGGCTGIAVSAPNPDAIKSALEKATEEKIPLVTMNSGSSDYQALGAMTHIGQDELIAVSRAARSSRSWARPRFSAPSRRPTTSVCSSAATARRRPSAMS